MDATAWVGIAGIGGTLLASFLGPMVSEWMRRKTARLDRLHEQRLSTYADALQATARFADNAREWSAIPLAELRETDDEELNRLVSRLRVVGSKKVYEELTNWRDIYIYSTEHWL